MTKLLWVFVGWTLFTWSTRLRNIVGDDTLTGGARGFALAVTAVFVVGAIAVPVIAKVRPALLGTYIRVAGGVTAAWWAMRLVTNLLGDGSTGFKVVHTILALTSIGLGLALWRSAANATKSVRMPARPGDTTTI